MAQSIVLKRSALSGKVPATSSLSLGEVAINTYDGRVFFKKSGSVESIEHILTTNSVITGSITLTKTGSFGELVVSQDGNFQRDIFVTRDIVANGDIDVLGSLTASLSNGYVWVGNSLNKTTLVPTSSFGGALSTDVNLLISKTGSYATTGSNVFVGNQTIAGNVLPNTANTHSLGSLSNYWNEIYLHSTSSIKFIENGAVQSTISSTGDGGVQIGNVVITTSSIIFVDDNGNTTQTVAQSSSVGSTSNFATTGSNIFVGNQTITGSLVVSGSANIAVSTATISSPFSAGNYPLSLFDGVYNFNFGFYANGVGSNRLSIYRNASQTYFDNSSGNFYFNSELSATSVSGIIYATNGVVSGSSQIVSILQSLNNYTSSIDNKFTTLSNVTSSLISKTGSYATTSSNTFYGNQTISGSIYVTGDFTVLGSSSIQNISSSTLNVGTNLITVAVNKPTVRFGGFAVIDSGSSNQSGSLLYDSVQDEFIFVHKGDGTNITSSHFILGPETYNDLGNETYIPINRLIKSNGNEHVSQSNVTDTGTKVIINSNTEITGSLDINNARLNVTASNSSAGNVLVSTNPTASYNSAFYNYSITSGSNARAGQMMSIWNGNTLKYTEVTTTDIGNTSTAVFSASLSGGNVLLHLSSSGVWNVRSIVNLL